MLPQSGYDHFPHTAHIYRKQPQSHVNERYYNVFQYPVKYEPLRKYRCLLHEFRLALELLVSDVSYIYSHLVCCYSLLLAHLSNARIVLK